MMDDRTPGYDEPDRDELTRPLSLSEWDYLVMCEQNETAEPYEGRS
jgi:hypothetical protein